MFNCETDIINYLKEDVNWRKHFPDFKVIGFDFPIFGCISKDRIGMVDIVFKRKAGIRSNKKYFVEVKYDKGNSSGDFWDSLKILGYVKAYNLYHFTDAAKPMIMIKKDILDYDFRTILYTLEIGWITFDLLQENKISFDIGFHK